MDLCVTEQNATSAIALNLTLKKNKVSFCVVKVACLGCVHLSYLPMTWSSFKYFLVKGITIL